MSSSFPGKTSEIPLPPTEDDPHSSTVAHPVETANSFAGTLFATTNSSTVTPTLYDSQMAAYYAYQSQYATAAQMVGYHPYFVPMVPMVAPIHQQTIGKLAIPGMQQMSAMHSTSVDSDSRNDESADEESTEKGKKGAKVNNTLPIWGNEKTMNLNPLILTNIQNSPYFKVNLYALKTYHEVIDEIWYQVRHLEPWEKGSRRVSGQTGMCGSVRGVGAGGIVSTPFCILYKLYTLRLTRKQVVGLLKHKDSPFIRAIGFMYIRYTQPPEHLWSWFEDYLDDEEELDVKAGGGQKMTIGQLVKHMLTKLDWFSTLFPRIPVPIQKDIEKKMNEYEQNLRAEEGAAIEEGEVEDENDELSQEKGNSWWKSAGKDKRSRSRSPERSRSKKPAFDQKERRRGRSRSRSKERRFHKNDKRRH